MFQFTHPGRGATGLERKFVRHNRLFQFTHPGRGATISGQISGLEYEVSIHAPREGCDYTPVMSTRPLRLFQFTHPGRGATPLEVQLMQANVEFQFTHPGRGATGRLQRPSVRHACFNSRTPGGVRHYPTAKEKLGEQFQFTHPGRGATETFSLRYAVCGVSIHAPREGCDKVQTLPLMLICSFNSRTPGGVRHSATCATCTRNSVSIHAPREGCDWNLIREHTSKVGFNSRTPGGVRPSNREGLQLPSSFQFTHPGRGATNRFQEKLWNMTFQFTHPGRGATPS